MAGDFNIHLHKPEEKPIKRFNGLLERQGITELIQTPSRLDARLDLILTNVTHSSYTKEVIPIGISDHNAVVVRVPTHLRKVRHTKEIKYRPYKSMNTGVLAEDIVHSFNDYDFSNLTANDAVKVFTEKHLALFDKLAPIRTRKLDVSKPITTISSETMVMIKRRDALYKINRRHTKLTSLNKLIKKQVKADHKQYIEKEIQKTSVWKVKDKLFKKEEPKLACDINVINNHYANISNEPFTLNALVKPTNLNVSSTLTFRTVTEYEVAKYYQSIKTRHSTSHDILGFAPKMLTYTIGAPVVLNCLAQIVNQCITDADFPDCLKTGIITPLAKIPEPTLPIHYRPVAVQPLLSLLIEKCMHDQTIKYLEDSNLLFPGQFGFRSQHSCEMAMTALTEFIYQEISQKKVCILVSLDLSKAFDVIIREYLFQKLECLGIDPRLFKSYLSGRAQVVKDANGNLSKIVFTLRGCPQGSVMGPLLFTIYLNDLPAVVKHCLLVLFADDSQLCISSTLDELDAKLEQLKTDLKAVLSWMKLNGMKLNLEKTQMIVFGSSANIKKVGKISVDLDGVTITNNDTLKSLGLTLDSKLTWANHINKLCRSMYFSKHSLMPLRSVMSRDNLGTLLNACVVTQANYMAGVWGAADAQTLKPIEKCLKSTARTLLRIPKRQPISEQIRNKLKWLLPKENCTYKRLCLIFLILRKEIPYFENFLKKNSDFHGYNTRNKGNLHVEFSAKNKTGNRRIQSRGLSQWNKLPNNVRNSLNYRTFRKCLKKYILANTV